MNLNQTIENILTELECETLQDAKLKCLNEVNDNPSEEKFLNILGVIYSYCGEPFDAAQSFKNSLRINSKQPLTLLQLGNEYEQQDQLNDARDTYNKALVLDSELTIGYVKLATVEFKLKNYTRALKNYEKAVALEPNDDQLHFNQGVTYLMTQKFDSALACFDQAIQLSQNQPEYHFSRGQCLSKLRLTDAAIESFKECLKLNPTHIESSIGASSLLAQKGREPEALKILEKSCEMNPSDARLHFNSAKIMKDQGKLEEALKSYTKAIEIAPQFQEAYINRGVIFKQLKLITKTMDDFNYVLRINPKNENAKWNKGTTELLNGNFKDGWRLHEARWNRTNYESKQKFFDQPLWLGFPEVRNKNIYLHSEQGYGDTIQYCRFALHKKFADSNIILGVQTALVSLISNMDDRIKVIDVNEVPDYFNYHCPLLSLPLALDLEKELFVTKNPYFKTDRQKKELWRKQLGNNKKKKIGVCWSSTTKDFENRNIPLNIFSKIFREDFEFHILQKVVDTEDRKILINQRQLVQFHGDKLADFSDTAALLENMDLIISSDTVIAHLAGALGKKLYILLPFLPDHRWLLERSDSPWYPTATIFRQKERGEWDPIISSIINRIRIR